MSKKYCSSCGKPNDITANFCMSCATQFVSLGQAPVPAAKPRPTQPVKPAQAQIENIDDDDRSGNNVQVPHITAFPVDIIMPKQFKTSVGDLAQTAGNRKHDIPQPQKNQVKTSRKKFLEEFKKEAGSIRP